MFQQTASSLRETFDRITKQRSSLYENLRHIESLYNSIKAENTTPEGQLPYPAPDEKETISSKKGMAISVRYAFEFSPIGSHHILDLFAGM